MEPQEKEWNRITNKYPRDLTCDIQCWLWCVGKNNNTKYFIDIFNQITKTSLFRYSSHNIFDIDGVILNKLKEYELV